MPNRDQLIGFAGSALGFFLVAASPARSACTDELVLDPTDGAFLTSDNLFGPNQDGLNCYAWQTFIALSWPVDATWPADPTKAGEPDRSVAAAGWGVPAQAGQPMTSATVWESYKAADNIFLPGAAEPSAWGVLPPPPSGCQGAPGLADAAPRFVKLLNAISKSPVDSTHGFNLVTGTDSALSDEIMEASGGWLTDQEGKLVFFERLVGKAEFDYILSEELYDAADQLRVATNADGKHPAGLSLPAGAYHRTAPASPQPQENLGAIEIKAAWRVLTGITDLYDRHLTTLAWVQRPDTGECSQEVVGLVGLHIIHKTETFPDFVWATFEHVDNVAETPGELPPPDGYAFNDPSCMGSACMPNQPRISCPPGSGSCTDLFRRDQPVQVTRTLSTPAALIDLNTAVQGLIANATGSKSVFQFYKLVNVLWDQAPNGAPILEPGANAKVPLVYGSFESQGNLDVANTTMETYVQTESCNSCHQYATIASSTALASDFSFLFGGAASAKKPSLVTVVKEPREPAD